MIEALGPLKAYTPDTVTDPKKLLDEFAAIRADGYAVNEGQMNVGVRALAVPVKGPGGETVAGLCIEAPAVRLGDDRIDDLITRMQLAAERIAKVATFDGPA
ncbi:IclR family transcriptional regulator C-terminal domain-containing protein [Actinomadura sp. 3N508]|uniref:IclR family transcriptional regulator domain-containing protein n=1 Tax=Actinomadura sp. 3N508 TaxID=3375153 RepID=UPI0037B56677